MQITQIDGASLKVDRNRATIADLPVELLLMVYEDFDLADLNSAARIHPHAQRVASIVFNEKFGRQMHVISDTGLNVTNEIGYSTNIANMHVMYSTLKRFGHLLTNLTIEYDALGEWECEKINMRINRYMINTLIEFTISKSSEQTVNLKHLLGPFSKVKVVRILDCTIERNYTSLSHVFPSLCSLIFTKIQSIHRAFINQHYAHLKEITVLSQYSNSEKLYDLLQLNAQVRKITIESIGWRLLKMISETVPNLEHLSIQEIDGYIFKGDEIRFDHMKSFALMRTINFQWGPFMLPFVFSDCIEQIFDKTIDHVLYNVILNNESLKKVSIYRLTREELQLIGEKLLNLVEFRTAFSINSFGTVDDIVQFIENHQFLGLEKVELRNCKSGENDFQDAIFEQIHVEWDMVEEHHPDHVTFVRRHLLVN